MAAPIAAGNAALARQYFLDGYYPSGSKVWYASYSLLSGWLPLIQIASPPWALVPCAPSAVHPLLPRSPLCLVLAGLVPQYHLPLCLLPLCLVTL